MVLLMHQLPELHWQTKKKIRTMSQFVIFVYIQAWFTAPSIYSAASNDLLLYKRLIKFRSIHKKISIATFEVFLRHPGYLTEESIVFSLFNEDLPMETRNILASRIGELDSGDLGIRKPTLQSFSAKSVITEFVGDRSRLLFDLFCVQTGFLLSPDWQMTPEYDTVKTALKNMSPLNDSSERALALAIRLNTNITRDDETYQELVQVVEAHRKEYKLDTKKDLKNLY